MKIKILKYTKKYETDVLNFIDKTDFTSRTKNTWRFNKMTATIAKMNDKIVGVLPFENIKLKFQNKYENVLWISALYVLPNYRNNKIGSKLLNHAESYFKRKFNYIFVMRHNQGTKAYKWYIKNNFIKVSNIISLEKKINKSLFKYNYQVLHNFKNFKIYGTKLLKSFKNNNKSFDGYKKRDKNFWYNLKYHYYYTYYDFRVIIVNNNEKIDYALVGKTNMRDNCYRLDILEYVNYDSKNTKLLNSIEDFGYRIGCKKIRFQTIKSNINKRQFLKNNFYIRWGTNCLAKQISDKKINFFNYKYFQTEYI